MVAAMASEIAKIKDHPKQGTQILLTGVGKVNAASRLASFLETHEVSLIVNLGFAGATPPYQVGDVVVIEKASYHDFDLSMFGYQKGQVPGYPESFHSDAQSLALVMKSIPGSKKGFLLTGDRFMTESGSGAYLVDMEGAALFQVAWQKKIPMVSVKVVSDIVGAPSNLEAYQSFESGRGAEALLQVYQSMIKE